MKVGIIGVGTTGAGIAQALAQTEEYEVFLCDISEELAAKGKARIIRGLERRTARGKMTREEVDAVLTRIYTGIKDIHEDYDLIVEAAIENMGVKRQTFRKLQHTYKKKYMFASNISFLFTTELEAGLNRPVIGVHFFNPVPVMGLVEVITDLDAPAWATEAIKETAGSIREVPMQVGEATGLMVNRLLVPMINEATGIYAERTADAEGIDSVMKLGANHPMGPLALGNLIGPDMVLAIMEVLQNEAEDFKCCLHPLLGKMVHGGRPG